MKCFFYLPICLFLFVVYDIQAQNCGTTPSGECEINIYPQSGDFSSGDCGRILISTPETSEGSYYSDYQMKDGEVRIKAILPIDQIGYNCLF